VPKNRKVLFLIIALTGLLLAGFSGAARGIADPPKKNQLKSAAYKQKQAKIKQLRRRINEHRQATWHYQKVLQVPRTPATFRDRWTKGLPDLRRLAKLWQGRALEHRSYARVLMAVVRHADQSLVRSGHASSPMRKELLGIVKAAKAEGISPFFILAIAGKESTFGHNLCDAYDAWGWDPCSADVFTSFTDGSRQVARGLRVKYMGLWGGRTIAEVGRNYCGSCGSSWADDVSSFMSSIFRAGSGMRWKDAVQAATQ
jgi:hypothetical protein